MKDPACWTCWSVQACSGNRSRLCPWCDGQPPVIGVSRGGQAGRNALGISIKGKLVSKPRTPNRASRAGATFQGQKPVAQKAGRSS
jgi:hypothetical protein